MYFEDICSFETESYIGIWDQKSERFIVLKQSDLEMWMYKVPKVETLDELDGEVYELIDEHIIGVSDYSNYTFKIDEE